MIYYWEKKCTAITTTIERMHLLLAVQDRINLSTDHRNLKFLFNPLLVVPHFSPTSLRKMLCLSLCLRAFYCTFVQITSVVKCMDKPFRSMVCALCDASCSSHPWTVLFIFWVYRLVFFEWSITSSVKKSTDTRRQDPKHCNTLCMTLAGNVWTPNVNDEIQLRLCAFPHMELGLYWGIDASFRVLWKRVFWFTMTTDVKTFIMPTRTAFPPREGEKYRAHRFFVSRHDAEQPSVGQLHWHGPKGIWRVSLLHSPWLPFRLRILLRVTWWICRDNSKAITNWLAAFGVPSFFVPKKPAHFKNETMRLVSKEL